MDEIAFNSNYRIIYCIFIVTKATIALLRLYKIPKPGKLIREFLWP